MLIEIPIDYKCVSILKSPNNTERASVVLCDLKRT